MSERANSFDTGIAAEYFVLSQLYRRGFEAYLSQGNKKSIDIRVITNTGKSISIDVKAVRGYSSLVVNNVVEAENHFVVCVVYNNKFSDTSTFPDVFVIPSHKIPELRKEWKAEKRLMKGDLTSYKNRWDDIC
ncbi:hypothetical protein ACW0FU_004331 [Vibrio vulnificus]